MKLFEILNSNVQYRTPVNDDAKQIVELKSQLYSQNGDNMPVPPNLDTEHRYIDVLTSKNNYYKIAVSDDNIIGYCSMKEYKPNKGIFGIGILKSYNGRGIGKTLMSDLIIHARTHGYNTIDCYVGQTNTPAIELYKTFGFTVTGKEDNDYIMELPLK